MANTRVTNPVTGFNSATEEGLKLPSGTNANQPSGVQGMIRNDTGETTGSSTSAIEHHNGTTWKYFAATESPDVVYPTSLKMYLDASNTNSYPGNGTTWFDLTTNGNNGAISNTSWNSGGYFDFNGTTSYITTGLTWPGSTKLSFSAWFRTSGGVDQYMIADFNAAGQNIAFRFAVQINSQNNLVIGTNNGGNGTFPQFGLITSYLNAWTNIAVTVDGSTIKVYLDAVQFGSTVTGGTTLSAGSQPFNIGAYGPGSNKQNFNGFISKVQFYDVILTQAEITALYNEGR